MKIALILLTVLFYLTVPALILRLCYVSKWASQLGAVLMCYVVGIAFGQTLIGEINREVPNILVTALIPLALPMLLFEIDVKSWKKMAGKTFLAMIIGISSLIVMIILGYFLFRDSINDANKIGGMLSGLYVGGTPNLVSLKAALNVSDDVFIAVNTVDIMVGAVYMLFLISIAKKIFSKFLLPYPHKIDTSTSLCNQEEKIEEKRVIKRFKKWITDVSIGNVLAAFGVSLLIALIGAGIGFGLIKESAIQMAVIILAITTLAIIASNIKAVKKIKGSFDTGMYLILIFCISVASMANFESMGKAFLPLFGFVTLGVFGTLTLHVLFCKIFKIDVDTTIITSVSLICSPPFVPVVAAAIKNKEVMMSGITVGVIGYALGNYIGVFMSYLLGLI